MTYTGFVADSYIVHKKKYIFFEKLTRNFWKYKNNTYLCTRVEEQTRRPGPVPGKDKEL